MGKKGRKGGRGGGGVQAAAPPAEPPPSAREPPKVEPEPPVQEPVEEDQGFELMESGRRKKKGGRNQPSQADVPKGPPQPQVQSQQEQPVGGQQRPQHGGGRVAWGGAGVAHQGAPGGPPPGMGGANYPAMPGSSQPARGPHQGMPGSQKGYGGPLPGMSMGPLPGVGMSAGPPPGMAAGPPPGMSTGPPPGMAAGPPPGPRLGAGRGQPRPSVWAQRQQQAQQRGPPPPRQETPQPHPVGVMSPRHSSPQQPQALPQQPQALSQQPQALPQQPQALPQQPPSQQQAAHPQKPAMAATPKQSSPVEQVTAAMRALSSSSALQIPKRKKKVEKASYGDKRIVVETNHLALKIDNPNMIAVHYDVTIIPDKPFRNYRPALVALQKKLYPKRYPAFDGKKNLYSYPELPLNGQEVTETVIVYDEERQQNKELTVTLKFANYVNLSGIQEYMKSGSSISTPQDAIQALDIVLRQPSANRFVTVGRSFFTAPPGNIISLGEGLDLWYGFFQSAIIGWKPYLNIDVAHKGFPAPNRCITALSVVIDVRESYMADPNWQPNRAQLQTFLDYIKNLKIIYEIPEYNIKRTHKVIGLSECPRSNRFQLEDKITKNKKEMTVQQYFKETYRYHLKYPHLPCLKAGSNDKPVSLPIELCRILEGQVTMKKMKESQTRAMVKEAAVDTDKRKQKILKSMQEVRFNSDNCLKEFGLSIADNFTKVEARILPAPAIDYRDGNNRSTVRVNVEKGVWKIVNLKFLSGADLGKWCILNTHTGYKPIRPDELRSLGEGFVRHGKEVGLMINQPTEIVTLDHQHKIETYFRKCQQENVKLVIVILPEKGGVTYACVKKMAELTVGILTQCLKAATVQRRMNTATFINVLQKINAKLNGVNHNITEQMWPDFFKRPVMVVGADVTHPAPDQRSVPSIAAVAASHDPKAFKYNMIWKLQEPRVEVIHDLMNIMVDQLKFFYRYTRHKPEKILFYRDGVSEGHFKTILNVELDAIRKACTKLQSDYNPPITFLVVQKRHHTRFFPGPKDAEGKNKNVPAGTVVDTEITHPTEMDFYLVSHASIQGTARPTKYHLLWDDSDMSEHELEKITYYLCHLFTRCTRSVSYPAPTYYAHLAAFRARSYTETEGSQFIDLDNLEKEQKQRKVKDTIMLNSPMYFV